jgi:hypothetical protein
MDWLKDIFDYLTDPSGLGFPLLISVGLFIIIWLMNKTSKGWKKVDTKIEQKKDNWRDTNLPYKPL